MGWGFIQSIAGTGEVMENEPVKRRQIKSRVGSGEVSKALTERDIQKSIIDYLRVKGVFCWENRTQGTYDPTRKQFRRNNSKYFLKGVSDILGVLPDGSFLAIEVKRPGGKISIEQSMFIGNINKNKGIAKVKQF